jgi:DNA repair exonuclease SbcCD nuclease subunit
MSKALIFSDLHIHGHKDRTERLKDCLEVLEWVFATADKCDCEYIFFLGDLFHERSKIDVMNYLHTFEIFMKHMLDDASHREMYLLVGNHDMYHKERWDVNSVKPLSAIPRISVIQSPVSLNLGGRKIDWLPHTENPIEALNEFKKNGAGDILFGHMAVSGALTNTFYGVRSDVIVEYDNDMVTVDASLFDSWDMTMLGHYHGAQKLSAKAEYIGSPLQLTFGEAFQEKHIVLLDLKTMEKEYIVNDFSPKHLIVTEQDVENEAYNLSGQFVRIAVENMGKKDLIDLQRKIARESKPLTIDLKQVDKKIGEQDATVIEEAKSILTDTKQMLEQYIKDKGVPDGLDAKLLLSAGEECLVEIISE